MVRTIEIYALSDPRDGSVRYIGKAVSAAARLKSHIRDARRRNSPVHCWIRRLATEGIYPAVTVVETCPEAEWRQREVAIIASARLTNPRLLNVADGGDQPFCPPAIRADNGRRVSAAIKADPRKARIRWLKAQLGKAIAQGHCTEETKAKLRQAAADYPRLFGEYASL